jgi:hypothetical protein
MSYESTIGEEKATNRRRSGPTRRELDGEKIYELASIGMSQGQVSDYFGISLSTFESHKDYLDIWREGRANFVTIILEEQMEIATNRKHKDQAKMLQHIGKTTLGQRETQNINADVSTNFEELLKLLK